MKHPRFLLYSVNDFLLPLHFLMVNSSSRHNIKNFFIHLILIFPLDVPRLDHSHFLFPFFYLPLFLSSGRQEILPLPPPSSFQNFNGFILFWSDFYFVLLFSLCFSYCRFFSNVWLSVFIWIWIIKILVPMKVNLVLTIWTSFKMSVNGLSVS